MSELSTTETREYPQLERHFGEESADASLDELALFFARCQRELAEQDGSDGRVDLQSFDSNRVQVVVRWTRPLTTEETATRLAVKLSEAERASPHWNETLAELRAAIAAVTRSDETVQQAQAEG